LRVRFIDIERTSFQGVALPILPYTVKGEEWKKVAIYVRVISKTQEYFVRIKSNRLELLYSKDSSQSKYLEKSICVR
jgi:hypothetical protein